MWAVAGVLESLLAAVNVIRLTGVCVCVTGVQATELLAVSLVAGSQSARDC